MLTTFTTNVFAQDTTNPNFLVISENYTDPERNNGIYLIEVIQIEGKMYTFTHKQNEDQRIIEMKGAEKD